jgi:hypothetical protein
LSREVVVVLALVLELLQRDDDPVVQLLPVLRLAERQVDVVRLVLVVGVLDLQTLRIQLALISNFARSVTNLV